MFGKLFATALTFSGFASALNNKEEFVKEANKLACYIYADLEFFDIHELQQETPYTMAKDGVTYKWNFCDF